MGGAWNTLANCWFGALPNLGPRGTGSGELATQLFGPGFDHAVRTQKAALHAGAQTPPWRGAGGAVFGVVCHAGLFVGDTGAAPASGAGGVGVLRGVRPVRVWGAARRPALGHAGCGLEGLRCAGAFPEAYPLRYLSTQPVWEADLGGACAFGGDGACAKDSEGSRVPGGSRMGRVVPVCNELILRAERGGGGRSERKFVKFVIRSRLCAALFLNPSKSSSV